MSEKKFEVDRGEADPLESSRVLIKELREGKEETVIIMSVFKKNYAVMIRILDSVSIVVADKKSTTVVMTVPPEVVKEAFEKLFG